MYSSSTANARSSREPATANALDECATLLARLLQGDQKIAERFVLYGCKNLLPFNRGQNTLTAIGGRFFERPNGIARDQSLLDRPIERLLHFTDHSIASRRPPCLFLGKPIRDVNRFHRADSQMTAGIGELLDEPTMPFIAVEVLLNPIQELIEQRPNDHSPTVIGRSLLAVGRRRRVRHQTMKSILGFARLPFASGICLPCRQTYQVSF